MYIIAGLGNPGRKYVNTRHNIGFEVIDTLSAKHKIKMKKLKHKAVYGEGVIAGEKVVLAKPQTFMNLSGECVREMMEYYKSDHNRLIVVYDDVDLPSGALRLRPKGGSGGHNGIKNIIYQLKSEEFPRVKIGVGTGRHEGYDTADFVLGKFTKAEIKQLIPIAVKATEAIEEIIKSGIDSAMNKYN